MTPTPNSISLYCSDGRFARLGPMSEVHVIRDLHRLVAARRAQRRQPARALYVLAIKLKRCYGYKTNGVMYWSEGGTEARRTSSECCKHGVAGVRRC